jgi:hypothetical protein
MVGASRKGVGLAHALFWMMVEGEVESRKIQGPSRLSPVEFLCDAKVLEVLVVGEDLNGVLRTLEVVSPLL